MGALHARPQIETADFAIGANGFWFAFGLARSVGPGVFRSHESPHLEVVRLSDMRHYVWNDLDVVHTKDLEGSVR